MRPFLHRLSSPFKAPFVLGVFNPSERLRQIAFGFASLRQIPQPSFLFRSFATRHGMFRRQGGTAKVLLAYSNREDNAALPLYQLPPELLLSIIHLCIDGTEPRLYHAEVCRLARVSHHWRHVITTAPEFWTTVTNCIRVPLLKLIVRRSKSLPLNIYWYYHAMVHNGGYLDADLFSVVVAYVKRWGALHFETTPSDNILALMGDKEAPQLRKITWGWKGFNSPQFRHWGDGDFKLKTPLLETLTAGRLPAEWKQWSSQSLSRLLRLELTGGTWDFPSAEEFHQIISSAPHLQNVRIHAQPWSGMAFDEAKDLPPVSLPHLTDFTVVDGEQGWLCQIIQCLEAPNLERTLIESNNSSQEWTHRDWYNHLGPLLWATVLRFLHRPKRILLTLSEWDLVPDGIRLLESDGSEPNQKRIWFRFMASDDAVLTIQEMLPILEDVYDLKYNWDIPISIRVRWFSDDELKPDLAQLRDIRGLDEIVLEADPEGLHVADWFSTPTSEWPLPDIKSITVTATKKARKVDRLLRMLHRRFKPSGENLPAIAPSPLKRLHVILEAQAPTLNPKLIEELEAELGTGVLRIDCD